MAFMKLDNVCYSHNNEQILKNISFNVPYSGNVAIVGNPGSGKTTLLKILNGNIFAQNNVEVKDTKINLENFKNLKRTINVVFDDDIFIKETVLDELKYPLTNLVLRPSEGTTRLNELIDYFELDGILDAEISNLSLSDRMLVKILAVLITYPEIIGFDDVINYLTSEDKDNLFKFLKKKGINYVLVTTNMEEVLYCNYLVCLYNGQVAMEGDTLSVLQEEKLLRRLGLNLPFYVDLSIQLGYYGLIDGIYLNKEDMVSAIWR